MLVSNLIRLGALATMVSGVLLLAAIFGGYLGGVLLVIAVLLVPVGMVGFHLLQRHAYGRMGRAAFWLVVLGSVVMLLSGMLFFKLGRPAGDLWQAWPPFGWVVVALVGGLVRMLGGFMLYGEATLQAQVLPPWYGVAFIAAVPVGVVTNILVFFLFSSTTFSAVCMFVVFGVVWLRLGAALWVTREVQAAHQRRPLRHDMPAKRVVAYGVAVVFLALVGGCAADAMIPVAPEDMKRGCHTDYYLRVFPTGQFYCAD
jgi:hypothetical protein